MDEISLGAETWLRELESKFSCEISNCMIGSPHAKYPSSSDAKLAMLRLAYLRGRHDATKSSETFEEFSERIDAANHAR